MKGYIYELVCPLTKLPIYVGSTTRNPDIRLKVHINNANNGSGYKVHEYIRSNNIIPIIKIIDTIEFEKTRELRVVESKWIKKRISSGVNLLNIITNYTSVEANGMVLKISKRLVEVARLHKKVTGVSIQKFVENGIKRNIASIPADIKSKMGIK